MAKKLKQECEEILKSLNNYSGSLEEMIQKLQRIQQLTNKSNIQLTADYNRDVDLELY